MESIEGTFRAFPVDNGITLVLVAPSGDQRRFIVKESDLRGQLFAFLEAQTSDSN